MTSLGSVYGRATADPPARPNRAGGFGAVMAERRQSALGESWALRARYRFNIGAALEHAQAIYRPARNSSVHGPDAWLAQATGIDRTQCRRYIAAGWLTERQADRVAVALGLHPALLWPNWWQLGAVS